MYITYMDKYIKIYFEDNSFNSIELDKFNSYITDLFFSDKKYQKFQLEFINLENINTNYDELPEFLPIINFSDYLIYKNGKVFSTKQNKFLKPYITRAGYEIVTLMNKGKKRKGSIHRLVAETFLKKSHSEQNIVNHLDSNRRNNDVSNLKWVTSSENNLHSYRMGKNIPQRGELHPRARLSHQDIVDIREFLKMGISYREIANKYNVSMSCIGQINRREKRIYD